MVKMFMNLVDPTDATTRSRDLKTLEDLVDGFVRQGRVEPVRMEHAWVETGGDLYVTVMIEYNLKQS